nr:nitroreductase family protein [Tissierella sp.]
MEIIKKRRSVRTFEDKKIENSLREKIENYLTDLEKDYTSKYKFPLIDISLEGKVGTYGVIKGANSYIGGVLLEGGNLVELGYLFEKIIIYLTSLDIGTCWLGGTFKRGEFFEAMDLKDDENLLLLTPIGYIEEKMSLKEKSMRVLAKSDRRKEFDELFFDENLDPLYLDDLKEFNLALEMIRIGPSASNKQPWRIIKINGQFNLYLKRTKDYAKNLDYDIQMIDMGIAQYHFQSTLEEKGIQGAWERVENPRDYEGLEYISTWI